MAGPDEDLGCSNRNSEIYLGNFAEPLNIKQQGPESVEFRERSLNESRPSLLVTDHGKVEAVVGVRSASAASLPHVPNSVGLDVRVACQEPVHIKTGRADADHGEKHRPILPPVLL